MANQDRMPGARFMAGTAGLAALGVLLGVLLGVGGYTVFYAEGLSYLSSDPAACVNCHIMRPQYESWQKGSHHAVAKCVDCHLPHDFIGKYLAKGENGYHHSKGFTFQDFHEPIMIKAKNARILQENCLACHADLVHELLAGYAAEGIEYHALRTRRAGAHRFVSVHVLVPAEWSVQQGHDLLERIEADIRRALPPVTVDTHLEPLGDPAAMRDAGLHRDD